MAAIPLEIWACQEGRSKQDKLAPCPWSTLPGCCPPCLLLPPCPCSRGVPGCCRNPQAGMLGVGVALFSWAGVGNAWLLLLPLGSFLLSHLFCRDLPTRRRNSRRLTTGRTTSG